MQTVIETPVFMADTKAAGMSAEEVRAVVDHLAANPEAGDVIQGTGGARKVRFAGKGKGKSGGYRVITFYTGRDVPLFLLNVFSKGERVNLSKAERNELRDVLNEIAETYTKGVAANAHERR